MSTPRLLSAAQVCRGALDDLCSAMSESADAYGEDWDDAMERCASLRDFIAQTFDMRGADAANTRLDLVERRLKYQRQRRLAAEEEKKKITSARTSAGLLATQWFVHAGLSDPSLPARRVSDYLGRSLKRMVPQALLRSAMRMCPASEMHSAS